MMRCTRIFENINEYDEIESLDQNKYVSLLAKYKALLLRHKEGETPYNVNDFGNLVSSLGLKNYPYVGGAAPRRIIPVEASADIYTANEAPPDQLIPFHHELAQVQNPPAYLFFYCDEPSDTGGETALIDSTLVYRFVNENFNEFMEKLKKYGARYTRVLPREDDKTSPLGRSFYNTYNVSSVEELEDKLNNVDGLDYEWLADGTLKVVSEAIPAIRFIDHQGGNAIYQWTFHNAIIAAFIGWQDCRNDRKKAVRFGNDDPMDENILEEIANFMEANKVCYQWQKGDIFAINNRLVMHSRNSFTGTRRVYASMSGDAITEEKDQEVWNKPVPMSDPVTFGFWRVDNAEYVAYEAIKNGYRRLDLACDYGNEKEVGLGIQRAIKDGICKRDELYISTKLWNTYHHPKHVHMALDKSLKDIGIDYVDEYLIHFPISMEFVPFENKYPQGWTNLQGKMIIVPNDINETWKAMEKLVINGKTKHIGLSSFNCQHIRQILSIATIKPKSLQIECHPHLSQTKLIRFVHSNGINVSAFSPLGATSYISLNMATQHDLLIQNKLIKHIANKNNKSIYQILLRWAIQRNTMPITKTCTVQRMIENKSIYDFYLSYDDVLSIDNLNINRRYNDPGVFCEETFGAFCPIYE